MSKKDDRPVVMITGGSDGLGLLVAETFLRHDYRVMILGRDPERLERAKDRLAPLPSRPDSLMGHAADVSVADQVQRAIDRVGDHFGRLDVLVNCVGKSDRGLIEKLRIEQLDALLRMNVHTALLCSQAALPLLEASGGVIVNLGSLAAKVGARYIGGYATAKHALAGMTQQLRLELKPRGVHVALVNPGPIRRDHCAQRQKPYSW